MNIVLASGSPRRRELLGRIVDNFQILESSFDENSVEYEGDVEKYVCDLSEGKADNVLGLLDEASIVIGCDTVVYIDGKILGKPENKEAAIGMLKHLSGNTHKVYSGITIINTATGERVRRAVFTEVKFMELDDFLIEKYVESGQCYGKAGAYGIQDDAAVFVEYIKGCYYNVVGLPLNTLFVMLRGMGVNL